MPAIMRIDQAGLPAGTPGRARIDGLLTGALVTLTSIGGGSTHRFELLAVPPGAEASVATLTQINPTTWEFTPTVDAWGSYRIRLIVDEGLGTESVQVRILAMLSPAAGILFPAWNETADPAGSLVNAGAQVLGRSENNAPDDFGIFPAGNPAGWWLALYSIANAIENAGSSLQDAYDNGQAIDVSGDGPVQLSRSAGEGALVTLAADGDHIAELWPDGIRGRTPGGPSSGGDLLILGGGGNSEGLGGDVTIDAGEDGGVGPGRIYIGTANATQIDSGGVNNEPTWTHRGDLIVTGNVQVTGRVQSDALLWEWNQTDVSQFGASIPFVGGNPGTITPSVVARGSGSQIPNPLLRFTLAGPATGPVVLPIANLSLPRRFAIEYTMRTTIGISLRDFGFVVYGNAGFQYGFALMSDLSATNRRFYRIEAGTWATAVSVTALTQGAQQKRRMEVTASFDPSNPGAGGPGEWRVYEERKQAAFACAVNDSPTNAMGFGNWTGQGPCDQIGIAFANAAAAEVINIEDFRIVALDR